MSKDYENKQFELTEKIALLEQEIAKQEKEADSIRAVHPQGEEISRLAGTDTAVLYDLMSVLPTRAANTEYRM